MQAITQIIIDSQCHGYILNHTTSPLLIIILLTHRPSATGQQNRQLNYSAFTRVEGSGANFDVSDQLSVKKREESRIRI